MFSYEASGGANCILVRSTVGTYGVWTHWALTVDANNAITNYINGAVNTGVGAYFPLENIQALAMPSVCYTTFCQ